MVERSGRLPADANDAMERYADGDDAAFGIVYDALAPRLWGFALALTGSEVASDDVIQQTLLQIHLARSRYVRGAAVLPWAFAIARNLIRDLHRRAWTEQAVAPDGPQRGSPMPDEELDRKRRAAAVNEEVRWLPEPLREAFLLVNVEGLPVAEAAEILGISPGNVKVRAHRARRLLANAATMRLRGV